MALLGVDERLHANTVQTIVLHEIKHIELDNSSSFDVGASKIEPLSQGVVRIRIVLQIEVVLTENGGVHFSGKLLLWWGNWPLLALLRIHSEGLTEVASLKSRIKEY